MPNFSEIESFYRISAKFRSILLPRDVNGRFFKPANPT